MLFEWVAFQWDTFCRWNNQQFLLPGKSIYSLVYLLTYSIRKRFCPESMARGHGCGRCRNPTSKERQYAWTNGQPLICALWMKRLWGQYSAVTRVWPVDYEEGLKQHSFPVNIAINIGGREKPPWWHRFCHHPLCLCNRNDITSGWTSRIQFNCSFKW